YGPGQPSVATPTPTFRAGVQPIERFDDNAATPDDVFEQIAAATAGVRTAAVVAAASTAAPATRDLPRTMPADSVAHAAPSAPGAGLSAQLSASPFAPALRHVLPMPATASFDIRALFGGGLSATYLAGLLAPAAEELVVHGLASPAWASFATAGTQAAAFSERAAPELDLAYVAPETSDVAPTARTASASSGEARVAAAELPGTYAAPLTTLRTALLSWNVESSAAAPSFAGAPSVSLGQPAEVAPSFTQVFAPPASSSAARMMSQSMSMPMLGDVMPSAAEGGSAWTAPGMIGDRAHGWSVAQERSASDLSLDFVAPELVLAARVYGLGPAEAAQAGRLALAGPAQLAAMASTVDRTFVQAMAIATERRESARAEAITTAYPLSAPSALSAVARGAAHPTSAHSAPPASTAFAAYEADNAFARAEAPLLPSSAFGVERRVPRGAFLWPSATVAALGLAAPAPDSLQSMSVAALELLAAQAVAEIGTFAAFADHVTPTTATLAAPAGGTVGTFGAEGGVQSSSSSTAAGAAASARATGGVAAQIAMPSLAEPAEADVLGAAAAMIPMARRARFDALYVALSQSPSGRTWSPAARAARALALAGRGEDAPVSAYERAASAWDVLPVVYATDGMTVAEIEAASAAGTLPSLARAASRARSIGAGEMPAVSARPGLSGLMSRAGEAIGSYVAPSTGELAQSVARAESSSSSSSRERDLPIVHRAPTAAQELVRTGRPSSRSGGGEVEIPTWFEAAARKMLDQRSATSSSDGGFSLSELTLVTAAPASHIAASSRASSHAAAPAPAAAASAGPKGAGAGADVDVDKIADDVYRQILVMMDLARSRNGEPYL
ncbi:MAG: hypothetical protein H0T46_35195, partial [Deltaproteobacteria bacterium]|nr:hypothetical protein [Deltaproteobacteria bacterium]